MVSASLRKSITDLTRRRARTAFAVATLALAVASICFFAIPTLIDRSMQREVRAEPARRRDHVDAPADARRARAGRAGGAAQRRRGRAAQQCRHARARRGAARARPRHRRARLRGTRRSTSCGVESGALPEAGRAVVDVQDANTGLYDGTRRRRRHRLVRRGERRSGSPSAARRATSTAASRCRTIRSIVLYAPAATVAALSGERGYGWLSFRLRRREPRGGAIDGRRGAPLPRDGSRLQRLHRPAASCARRATGRARRTPRSSPSFLSVITVLALLSALVLISNTMTTLVAEQTGRSGSCARSAPGRARWRSSTCARRLLLGALGRSGDRARHRDLEPARRASSASSSGRSTSASASMRPSSLVSAARRAPRRRRSPPCRRSAAASASTCARRSSPPARCSAGRARSTGRCGA